MAKYYILSNGQKYKVSMSDVTDYTMTDNLPTEDIIHYTVNLDEGNWAGTISAWIENPSQHTLYLIEQDRCWLGVNVRNFSGHSPTGSHWDDRPVPHSSGLGRSSYRFHKHWSLNCNSGIGNKNLTTPIKIQDTVNIEIPIHFFLEKWNVKGYYFLRTKSEQYRNPYRDSFYFDFRLALISNPHNHHLDSEARIYQTKSKITRITFER